MCGPAGSGKSMYARGLEQQGMARLSLDVLRWRREASSVVRRSDEVDVEEELRSALLELVAAGRDVVLDLSFWSRQMREDYRRMLEPTGVVPETVYLATERETVLARVRSRRGRHADDVVVSAELAAHYFDHFEPPTTHEGPLTVITQ
ncbi:ATP-binding protein [Allobranchiibius sp. CTAmp26]|uniref:AAA family ATPase n=1 Tax=Allobranchiibius sp. CTAmp26 TaxID=2815214 RepID=UPI001FB6B670|nr:ATP-binding protein [Allobranchiibius sp. CTAmp26]